MDRVQCWLVISSVVCLILWLLLVNLHKVIHYNECQLILKNNKNVQLSRTSEYDNVLSVMSYNVNNMPTHIFVNKKQRLEKLQTFLKTQMERVDVFVFQEVFTDTYINGLNKFFTEQNWSVLYTDPKKNYLTLANNGLFVASRYEIKNEKGINFRDCEVFDCLSKKGAIRFSIEENGYKYIIVNTHLQDATFDMLGTVRRNQLKQIKNDLVENGTDAILGDLNMSPNDNVFKYGESLFGSVLFPNEASFPSMNKTLDGTFGSKIASVEVVDPKYDSYVSDHLPILVYITGA